MGGDASRVGHLGKGSYNKQRLSDSTNYTLVCEPLPYKYRRGTRRPH